MQEQEWEIERIKALKKYNILDTPPDESFDRITKLAANLLKVPIAIVSMVDTDRIWFKSRYGLDVNQIDRDPGLCASAILSDELYLVEDARADPRTLSNPLVAGDFGLRFYAAVPLNVSGGFNLGTLCVLDKSPRTLEKEEQEILQNLADLLIDQLELRLAARKAVSQQNELLDMAIHDIKNPLTTIPLWTSLIRKDQSTENLSNVLNKIDEATEKMIGKVNQLLKSSKAESGQIKLRMKRIHLTSVVQRVVDINLILAKAKNQQLNLKVEDDPTVYADETRLSESIDNILNNAIKYSSKGKNITIRVRQLHKTAYIEIIDEGPGLSEADKEQLFKRFRKLSAKPTGGEQSTGLGLSIAKLLVEAQHGSVYAESKGLNQGSKFTIELPVL